MVGYHSNFSRAQPLTHCGGEFTPKPSHVLTNLKGRKRVESPLGKFTQFQRKTKSVRARDYVRQTRAAADETHLIWWSIPPEAFSETCDELVRCRSMSFDVELTTRSTKK